MHRGSWLCSNVADARGISLLALLVVTALGEWPWSWCDLLGGAGEGVLVSSHHALAGRGRAGGDDRAAGRCAGRLPPRREGRPLERALEREVQRRREDRRPGHPPGRRAADLDRYLDKVWNPAGTSTGNDVSYHVLLKASMAALPGRDGRWPALRGGVLRRRQRTRR